MLKTAFFFYFLLITELVFAQNTNFTRQDTLRGSITPERAWWDLTYYHLQVKVTPEDSAISGSTTVTYKVLKPAQVIQIDLQQPLRIEKALQDTTTLEFWREGNAYFIELTKKQLPGNQESIQVFYSGRPRVAVNPPWDGGVQWARDSSDNWFIATCMTSPIVC
jgi:hypothetical protein